MKKILIIIIFLSSISLLFSISPEEAIEKLKQGNERFATGNSIHPNHSLERIEVTAKDGQKPFATVLACSDSRSPIEAIFDQGVGDIFVVRVAGNVADVSEIASIEYSTEHLHTPLLLVLGHTHCGAVTAVTKDAELHGHLPMLAKKIKPSADKAKKNNHSSDDALINSAIEANVFQSINDILTKSKIVSKLVKEGKLQVVGAIYNLHTGGIEWLGSHPEQAILVQKAKDVHYGDGGIVSFFSTSNAIYMVIFVILVSLIASIVIFIKLKR